MLSPLRSGLNGPGSCGSKSQRVGRLRCRTQPGLSPVPEQSGLARLHHSRLSTRSSHQWAPSIKNAEDSSSESCSAESSEITRNNRMALNLSPSKPARSLQKKYGDAFEIDFRARLGVLMKIHSRFIARPLNRFTHVESIQPGFQVLSNGHESIQRTRFNGFKFNRRRPVVHFFEQASCSL